MLFWWASPVKPTHFKEKAVSLTLIILTFVPTSNPGRTQNSNEPYTISQSNPFAVTFPLAVVTVTLCAGKQSSQKAPTMQPGLEPRELATFESHVDSRRVACDCPVEVDRKTRIAFLPPSGNSNGPGNGFDGFRVCSE